LQIRRIGIALAVHEPRIDWFAEQLRSLQAQTFNDWRCVITFDSPAARVTGDERLTEILSDPRFRWTENARRLGAAKNFERAIQETLREAVDAIACCDYDDRWYPAKLETLARALERTPGSSLVHSDLDLFDERGKRDGTAWRIERRCPEHAGPWHILVRNVVTGCSMLMDAELARRYPEVPREARLHDRWYALAASCHGGAHVVTTPLLGYRLHAGQDTGLATYRGLLAGLRARPPSTGGAIALVRECVRVWINARELLRAATERGVPIPRRDRSLFTRKDLGASLLLAGAGYLRGDRVLARAALAAAVGKLVSTASRGAVQPLPERTALPPRP
jgi:hypothetical protein